MRKKQSGGGVKKKDVERAPRARRGHSQIKTGMQKKSRGGKPVIVYLPADFIGDVMLFLSGSAVKLYLLLSQAAFQAGGNVITIPVPRLAKVLHLSVRMIQKDLGELEDADLIVRRKKRPGPSPNIIQLPHLPARRRPQTIQEWVAALCEEPPGSPRITEQLITELRAAAGNEDYALFDAFGRLYDRGDRYDLKEMPEKLHYDVAQQCAG